MNPKPQINSKNALTTKTKHFHEAPSINQTTVKKQTTNHKGMNLFLNKEPHNTITFQTNPIHPPQHMTFNKDQRSKNSYFQTCLSFHKDKTSNNNKPKSPQNIMTPKNTHSFRMSRNNSFTINTYVNINMFNNNISQKHNSSLKKHNSNLYYSTYNVNDSNLKLLNENPPTSLSSFRIPSINNNNLNTNQLLKRNHSLFVPSPSNQKHYSLTLKKHSLNKTKKTKLKIKQLQIPTLYQKPKNTQINEYNGIVYYELSSLATVLVDSMRILALSGL